MSQLLRTNPGILVTLVLMGACLLVCTVLGLLMKRGGASLRPIYWFAGFFALVVLPQFCGHLYRALHASREEAPRMVSLGKLASAAEPQARTAEARELFGPNVDPQLVVDVRNAYGGAFAEAEFAQFAVLPNGDTVLLARFGGYSPAEKAWVKYLRDAGLSQLGGQGDSQRGYVVTRPTGDRAYALHMQNMVGIWTGANDDAIRQRMAAGRFEIPSRTPLGSDSGTGSMAGSSPKPKSNSSLAVAAIAGGGGIYLFLVVLYFFKGAAWAGSSAARPEVAPVSAPELASRLEAINSLDVPFRIEAGATPNELLATWRYADAKWVDLARARGLRRTFRIRLRLDEKDRVVRATDYVGGFDWSAGRGGAQIEWKAMLGIVFFQYEHRRVYGLQLDEHDQFKPEISYAYTFNLQEMKSPLIDAITRGGWTWRPTVWQGPRWLRWLTE